MTDETEAVEIFGAEIPNEVFPLEPVERRPFFFHDFDEAFDDADFDDEFDDDFEELPDDEFDEFTEIDEADFDLVEIPDEEFETDIEVDEAAFDDDFEDGDAGVSPFEEEPENA